MAMSLEHINEVLDKPAVTCCRTEKGSIIGAENLESPDIFPDLEDSGLLKLPANCLKVKNVLGAKLLKTVDSLTPLTQDLLEGVQLDEAGSESVPSSSSTTTTNQDGVAVLKLNKKAGTQIALSDLEDASNIEKLQDSLLIQTQNALKVKDVLGKTLLYDTVALTALTQAHFDAVQGANITNWNLSQQQGTLKIKIGEGKNIDIEVPLMSAGSSINPENTVAGISPTVVFEQNSTKSTGVMNLSPKKIRTLTKKHFKIEKVELAQETKIEGTTLFIRENIAQEAKHNLVVKVALDIVTPDKYNTYSETVMDVQPIVTKEPDHKLGTGVSRVLDGVVIMVTGTDENGVQIGEFGSSDGILEENVLWGRPGAPDKGDIIIRTQVTVKAGTNMERPGPYAAHMVTDIITQEIREALKKLDDSLVVHTEELTQYRRPGQKKVVIIKEIMGQGAMHDNLILPVEPVGVLGGKPNVDLGNLPLVLSPLEVLDGGIHALTCIGPASKETSRHYYREPLVLEAMNDEEIDLCGIVFIGSPQVNDEKFYISERLGMLVEGLDVEGAIITTEGFGNNHIDFASHIEQVGMRGISVVGMSFAAMQGALVVGNKYMTHMVDHNKSLEGIENEILACNTLCQEDAINALAMLKSSMGGEKVSEAERKWNPHVKEANIEIIEKVLGRPVPRADRK